MAKIHGKAKVRFSAPTRQNSVAIVGFGKTKNLVYNLPDDVPIWSLSGAPTYKFPRLDVVFEMHPMRDLVLEGERYERLQTELPYPVFMLEKHDEIPSSRKYPLEHVETQVFQHLYLGGKNAQYFDSSMPFMLALAVLCGYEKIYIYGFELRTDTEYRYQRIGAALIIGWAMGQGVDVILPEDSALLPRTLYGYTDFQHVNRDDLFALHNVLSDKREVFVENLNNADGDIEDFGLWTKRVSQAEGGMHVLKGLIDFCNEKKVNTNGDSPDDAYTISRQNLEQVLHEMYNQQSDWMGRLNVAHTKVKEGNGKNKEKAEQKREDAFVQMYKRAGAVHVTKHIIEKLDRKQAVLLDFDDPFFQYQQDT